VSEPGGDAPIRHRLDPDAAARSAEQRGPDTPPPPDKRRGPSARPAAPTVIDTRRYRWAIGGLGLTLVLVLSVYEFATHGVGSAGVMAGKRLHMFSAPLASSNLEGDANANPPCSPAKHDPRALNICLLVRRTPLVLAFFVTGSDSCTREVDTLQRVSASYATSEVAFAAVAVKASHAETRSLAGRRGWTIPVAYDRDGTIGELYGVAICPLIELAARGGTVAQRLIGERWLSPAALDARVRALLAGSTR
jgi:hypothetical protein